MRSSNRGLKRKQNPAAFRADLRVGVTYTGEMPRQHRGEITDTLYVWNTRHPTRWVDKRDLPGLIKEFSVDNLDGEWIAEFKKHKKEREKKVEREKKQAEAEQEKAEPEPEPELPVEEVEDDI